LLSVSIYFRRPQYLEVLTTARVGFELVWAFLCLWSGALVFIANRTGRWLAAGLLIVNIGYKMAIAYPFISLLRPNDRLLIGAHLAGEGLLLLFLLCIDSQILQNS
jgi:hypothetical protein